MRPDCPRCGKALAPTLNINAAIVSCVNGHAFTSIELMKARPATIADQAVHRAVGAIKASSL